MAAGKHSGGQACMAVGIYGGGQGGSVKMALSLFGNICQTRKVRQSTFQRDSGSDFARYGCCSDL